MAYLSTEDVDNLSDEDISQILGLSTTASKQSRLELQSRLATALRTKGTEKGQMAGDVYIPPNPFDTAMDTYDHLSGILDANKIPAQADALDTSRQQALNRFAQLLL